MAKDKEKLIKLDVNGEDLAETFGVDFEEWEDDLEELHQLSHEYVEIEDTEEHTAFNKGGVFKALQEVVGGKELTAQEAMLWGWVAAETYRHIIEKWESDNGIERKRAEGKKSKGKGIMVGRITVETNGKDHVDSKIEKALKNLIKELED